MDSFRMVLNAVASDAIPERNSSLLPANQTRFE